MANTVAGILLTGILSARPGAATVSAGTLYSATDTGLLYQSDGVSSWTTWATLGTSGAVVNPMTTLGDIIYGAAPVSGGVATPARQGIGGSNTVLHGGSIPPAYTAVVEGDFGFTNITTANATTSQHGLLPKLNGSNTQYLDGTGAFSTPGGGGGGGITHAYVGYNTVGGTLESMTLRRAYCQTFTPGSNGWLASIGAYVEDDGSTHVSSFTCALLDDNSGVPGKLLAFQELVASQSVIPITAYGQRWLHMPIGYWLTSGTPYWMAVMVPSVTNTLRITYDAGHDYIYLASGDWWADGTFYTPTDSSRKYSIRGDFLT